MRPRLFLAASLLVLPLSSCFCFDLLELIANPPEMPDMPDAGLNEMPDNAIVISEDDLEWVTACMLGSLESDALLDAAFDTYDARDDGTVEVELSDDHCLRFTRTMAGGRMQSARFYRLTGETDVVFSGDEVQYVAFTHDEAVWERDAGGVVTARLHDNAVALPRGAESPWEVEIVEDNANRTRTTTRFDSNGNLEWRITITETADGTMQTVERVVDGETVTETTYIDIENRAQAANCNDAGVTCDDATAEVLDAAMRDALKRGSKCLREISQGRDDTWMRYVLLQQRWTEAHAWGCLPSGCGIARWCDTCQDSGDPLVIDIDFNAWQTFRTQNPEMGVGVLFHEMMHGVLGYHPDEIVNSDIYDEGNRREKLMRRYTDRVNACEAFCFYPSGTTPTKCACAACFETKVCDDRCSGFESCIEYDNGVAIMSEAVGTACVEFDEGLGDHGESKGTWYSTKAECDASACVSAGGKCESKSVSCDEGCE